MSEQRKGMMLPRRPINYGLSSRDMLKELNEHTAPEMAVHGTQLQRHSSIRADGLHRGKRSHLISSLEMSQTPPGVKTAKSLA